MRVVAEVHLSAFAAVDILRLILFAIYPYPSPRAASISELLASSLSSILSSPLFYLLY